MSPSSNTFLATLSFLSYLHSSSAAAAKASQRFPGALRTRMKDFLASSLPRIRRAHRMYSMDTRSVASSIGGWSNLKSSAPSTFAASASAAHLTSYSSSTDSYTADAAVASPRASTRSAAAKCTSGHPGSASLARCSTALASSWSLPSCHAANSSQMSGKFHRDMSAWSYASATRVTSCGCAVSPASASGVSFCGLDLSQLIIARHALAWPSGLFSSLEVPGGPASPPTMHWSWSRLRSFSAALATSTPGLTSARRGLASAALTPCSNASYSR